jgi:hypothetical protein
MKFDIIICVGPNDEKMIHQTLPYNLKNVFNYNKVYLISPLDLSFNYPNVFIINEKIFPFNLNDVHLFIKNNNRSGWYLQQLIKLYAGFVIPNLEEFYLVIDADTAFLKPTTFFQNNLPLYNFGMEYHLPYFEHMKKLDSSLEKQINVSGICHHMMFNKFIIKRLFKKVENNYKDLKFWEIFLKQVSPQHFAGSGASEYEIYFNFIIKNYSKDFKIRELKFLNTGRFNPNLDFDYISVHWWMNKEIK